MDIPYATPLLQPIAANTPLAALLNRWLVALAPAAALINPRRPSIARDCLHDVTQGVHFFHQLVTKTIARLEAGKDMQPLMRFVRLHPKRPSLCRPVADQKLALTLAMRGAELHTSRQVYKMVDYTHLHLDKLLTLPSPFTDDRTLLQALSHGGYRAAFELDEMESTNPQGAADALAILYCVLAADSIALQSQLEAIEARYSPVAK